MNKILTKKEMEDWVGEAWQLALQKMSAKRMDAADEVTRLREALRNISLASQNSMSSKEECGSLARAALNIEDLEE